MEFVEGTNLAARLNHGPLAPRAAAELVETLARAIHYAHTRGIVHRDLTPGNVLLIDSSTDSARDAGGMTLTSKSADALFPKITDFGLAKLLVGENVDQTQTGAVLGTPSYMAPEQAEGNVRLIGPRTDVYGLGAVLYAALTAKPPFQADSGWRTTRMVIEEAPVPPSKHVPQVPRDLETTCLKSLRKAPHNRYGSAEDLADDLRRYLNGEPITARPTPLWERALKWARRRPAIAALYAAIVALVVVAVGSTIVYQREQIVQQHLRESTERQARATEKVDALEIADTVSIPLIVRELESLRAEAEPLVRERYAAAAPESWKRCRFALALLRTEPELVDELLKYVPKTTPDELLILRDALRGHAERVTALWPRLEGADPAARLRYSALLAGFLAADERWQPFAPGLVDQLVRLNPLELAGWMPVLDPIHRPLTPSLLDHYQNTQLRLKGGELDVQDIVASATQFDLSATLLARYAADQAEVLADLLETADPRHYAAFLESDKKSHRASVAAFLQAVVDAKPEAGDEASRAFFLRQAHAAATLARFAEWQPAWTMLKHTPDPTARSYLIHGMAPRGVEPLALIQRFAEEPDVSARRALLLALGEFDPSRVPASERETLTRRLLDEFRDHPDAGLHSAIDWLLRQKWGRAGDLDRITAALGGKPAGDRKWLVNKEGQTFTIIRGPVEFTMGSPPDEPGRVEGDYEMQYQKTIPRSFAIGTRHVTVAEFLRFRKDFNYRPQHAPEPAGPISSVSWQWAVTYCRWLSEQEGLPEEQMCYPKVANMTPDMKLPNNFLERKGYRLPTEAEWEYACRSGAVTARPYGRGTELLGRYAWFLDNSHQHAWPCGRLKPNDFGLFDALGNVSVWCADKANFDRNPIDDKQVLALSKDDRLIYRGGSWYNSPSDERSAYREARRQDDNGDNVGFRIAFRVD